MTDGFVLTLTACITITYQDNIFSLTLLKAMPQEKLINTLTKSQLPYFVGFKLFGFIAADRPCYQKKIPISASNNLILWCIGITPNSVTLYRRANM